MTLRSSWFLCPSVRVPNPCPPPVDCFGEQSEFPCSVVSWQPRGTVCPGHVCSPLSHPRSGSGRGFVFRPSKSLQPRKTEKVKPRVVIKWASMDLLGRGMLQVASGRACGSQKRLLPCHALSLNSFKVMIPAKLLVLKLFCIQRPLIFPSPPSWKRNTSSGRASAVSCLQPSVHGSVCEHLSLPQGSKSLVDEGWDFRER